MKDTTPEGNVQMSLGEKNGLEKKKRWSSKSSDLSSSVVDMR